MNAEITYLYANKTADEVKAALYAQLQAALAQKYGAEPDALIVQRVEQEWQAILACGRTLDVALMHELCLWLRAAGHPYRLHGSGSSSFILYLLGITACNPLPPHYYCPKCRRVTWVSGCRDGFDLPQDALCESDRTPLEGDGHDLDWQLQWCRPQPFLGDLRVPDSVWNLLLKYLRKHWLYILEPSCKVEKLSKRLVRFASASFCTLSNKVPQDFWERRGTERIPAYLEERSYWMDRAPGYPLTARPTRFSDLLCLDAWHVSDPNWSEVRRILEEQGFDADVILYREDAYRRLLSLGASEERAAKLTYSLALGHLTQEYLRWVSRERGEDFRRQLVLLHFPPSKAHRIELLIFNLRSEQI